MKILHEWKLERFRKSLGYSRTAGRRLTDSGAPMSHSCIMLSQDGGLKAVSCL